MKNSIDKSVKKSGADMVSLKRDFVTAGHIIVHQQLADGFAHISIRLPEPENDKMIFMPRISPVILQEKDLFIIGFDEKVHQSSIHTAIYRARRDAGAVIHTHSPYVIALSLLGRTVEPIHNYSAFFHDGVPLYETGGQVGNQETAEKIVQALDTRKAIIQKGHGAFIVGQSVQDACLLAIFLEESAKYLLGVLSHGEPRPLSLEEARRIAEQTGKPSATARGWDHFRFLALRQFPL